MNFRLKLITGLLLFAMIAAVPGLCHSSERIARIKQSVKSLDLSKAPSIEELMAAGQLGGQLYPTKKLKYSKKLAQSQLEFGQAIEKWNRHEYKTAVKMFRKFIRKHPNNPWTDETRLHIGCDARYNGRYNEAERQFQRIIDNNKGKQYEGAKRLMNKARMRLGVLRFFQNDIDESSRVFKQLKKESLSWRERTYASNWITELSRIKKNRREMARCGVQALSYLFKSDKKIDQANEIEAMLPDTNKGHTIKSLLDIATDYQYDLVGVKLSTNELDQVPLPAILQIAYKKNDHRGHYWILEKTDNKSANLYDPQNGLRFNQSLAELNAEWNGRAIIKAAGHNEEQPGIELSAIEMESFYGGCCGIPKPEIPPGDPCKNAVQRPDPDDCDPHGAPIWKVNAINLNLFMTDIPLWYKPAVGPSIKIKLSYNSASAIAQNETFGNKWQFNYGSYLVVDTAGNVTVFMPDGRRDVYPYNGSEYDKPHKVFNTLTKLAENHFELTFLDGTVYVYNIPAGTTSLQPFLIEIRDAYGQKLTMSYNSEVQLETITDAQDRVTTLIYNAEGLVTQVNDPFNRSATFEYDSNKNLTKIADMAGFWTEFSYDSDVYLQSLENPRGRWAFNIEPSDGIDIGGEQYPPPGSTMWENHRITVTNPMGGKEEFFYSGLGLVQNQSYYVSPNDYVEYLGNSKNNLQSAPKTYYSLNYQEGTITGISYPYGESVSYTYDSTTGKIASFEDGLGLVQYTYNTNGKITSYTDGNNNTTYINYYPNNIDIENIESPLGTMILTYNNAHDITSILDLENNLTEITYDTLGKILSIIEAKNTASERTAEFVYDPTTHNLLEIKVNGSVIASYSYDSMSRIDSYTNANGVTLFYDYNQLDVVTKITYPDSKFIEKQLSSCCPRLIDSIVDRSGQSTYYAYDALKRLTQIKKGNDVYEYEYDPNGNMIRFTDPKGNQTAYEYDLGNRISKKIHPGGKFETYEYLAGLPWKMKTARNIVKTYSYDGNHNIISVSYSDTTPTVGFEYDAANRITKRSDGVGIHIFNYDSNSNLTSVNGPYENDTITYTYNEIGQRSTILIDDRPTISYTYDVLSRLISAQTDSGVFSYEYSGANTLIQKFIRPNGSFTEYVYNDPIKRLTEIVNKKDDQSIISKSAYMYTDRDVVGTETVTNGSPIKTFQDGLITYEYNKVNQLLATNNQQETFDYDADGNLIKSFTPDGYILNMGYDAENRLIWSEYIDDNQITHRTEYKYTGDHFLAEIKKLENGTQVSVTRMIRDGILSLQDRNESNQIISEYLWGDNFGGGIGRLNAARIDDNSYYHLYDGRGNVKAVIDNTQNVAASYNYGPFGELRATTGTVSQPYQFSTKRLDERTGLLYYGYRHYSSSIGRWTARDPLGLKGGDINLYRFVQNDPINLVDPYGLWSIWGGSTGVAAWGPWGGNAGSGFAFDSDAGAGAYTTTGTTEGAGLSVGYEVGFYTGSICGETEIVSFGAGPVSIGFVSDYKGNWGFVIGAAKGAPIEGTMSVNDTLFFPFSGDETNPCH